MLEQVTIHVRVHESDPRPKSTATLGNYISVALSIISVISKKSVFSQETAHKHRPCTSTASTATEKTANRREFMDPCSGIIHREQDLGARLVNYESNKVVFPVLRRNGEMRDTVMSVSSCYV